MNSSTMKETSNQSAHTPGPWHATIEEGYTTTIDAHGDETVCLIAHQDPQRDGHRNVAIENANTRLIAAAPELLRLVEHLEQLIQPVIEYPHACDANSLLAYRLCQLEGGLKQARAAIAKARK